MAHVYKIERNTSLKDFEKAGGDQSIYPFKYMNIGDSVFIADKEVKAVYQSAYFAGRKHGMKFKVSKVIRNGDEVVGVERIPMDEVVKKSSKPANSKNADNKNETSGDTKPETNGETKVVEMKAPTKRARKAKEPETA